MLVKMHFQNCNMYMVFYIQFGATMPMDANGNHNGKWHGGYPLDPSFFCMLIQIDTTTATKHFLLYTQL